MRTDHRGQVLRLLAGVAALAASAVIAVPLITSRVRRMQSGPTEIIMPGPDTGAELSQAKQPAGGAQLLVVDSEPEGATLLLDGKPTGLTPISTEVRCAPGAPVNVVVKHAGYRLLRRTFPCAPDTLTRLRYKLNR